MPRRPRRIPHPFVPRGELEAFAAPEPTWKRLLDDLSGARGRILIENYIFEDGVAGEAVLERLIAAAERGLDVRVHVDAVGSLGLGARSVERLRGAGGQLRFFNPIRLHRLIRLGHLGRLLQRTHRRIVVVDRKAGWVGGLAFSDDWWPREDGTDPVRETMLRLGGPVIDQLAVAFERLWGRPRRPLRRRPAPIPGSGRVRVVPQDPRRHPGFRRALYWRIGEAHRRIWITTPYFIPPLLLRLALRAARRRGTDVRLLLPGSRHDHPAIRFAGRRYYGNLLRAGIRIWEYQPRFLHAKAAVFDGEWSLVGSPNLDRWSLFLNHEIAVEARDRTLAAQLETQFREDLALSREITFAEWRRRPLRARFLEHFFGVFDRAF